jgi:hypothetical protein
MKKNKAVLHILKLDYHSSIEGIIKVGLINTHKETMQRKDGMKHYLLILEKMEIP